MKNHTDKKNLARFLENFKTAFLFLSLVSFNIYSDNKITTHESPIGTLKLIGDNSDYVIADNMSVYFNNEKLFTADNPPVLHAYFTGIESFDIAVIGMCANGGCLYRIIQISHSGKVLISQEIGFARIERAKITHDYDAIYLNDFKFSLSNSFE